MKRYLTRVVILLVAGMLVSCGGGGDSASGGGAGTPSGATPPANESGGTPPANESGGTPPNENGGNAGNENGGANPVTLPSAGALVEESDAAVSLSAGWTPSDSRIGWSAGAAMQSSVAGATASFTFTGTSVRWIGSRSRDGGIALVRVDGGPAREVDLFARPREWRTPVITLYDLSPGQHTLTIEVTGRQNAQASSNVVVVDAFEVEPPIVSHLQETDPDVTLSGVWTHLDDEVYSGGGVRTDPDPAIGGARFAETADAKATLKFRGTSVSWIGYRGPDAGIARVRVDGGPATEVDMYAPKLKLQEVVFTATGLADTDHTLTIEVTGRKNDASSAAKVFVDAFDVTTPGRRYQERNRLATWDPARASISYSGVWNHGHNGRVWSEGTASTSEVAGSIVTFSFTGTSVSWIGCVKASCGGTARIYIDGAFVEEVRNHRSVPIEGFQHTIFRADGLTDGPHTLMIEVVTDGAYIVVDAFDVHPAEQEPVDAGSADPT